MNRIFTWVATTLLSIAKATHLTYNQINVIVYYLIIPLTWCIMFDMIIKLPISTPLFLLLWIIIYVRVRQHFSEWCDRIFVLSQKFICLFGEYVRCSVLICVLLPVFIYLILLFLMYKAY